MTTLADVPSFWAAKADFIKKNRPALVDLAEDTMRIIRWYLDPQNHKEAVEITFRELAGDCAHALGKLAETLRAEVIVVGSRRRGVRSSIQEYLGGSVAVHLAHRQHRCVVVVPVSPLPAGDLPWEEGSTA